MLASGIREELQGAWMTCASGMHSKYTMPSESDPVEGEIETFEPLRMAQLRGHRRGHGPR